MSRAGFYDFVLALWVFFCETVEGLGQCMRKEIKLSMEQLICAFGLLTQQSIYCLSTVYRMGTNRTQTEAKPIDINHHATKHWCRSAWRWFNSLVMVVTLVAVVLLMMMVMPVVMVVVMRV